MWIPCETPAALQALLAASADHPIGLFKHSTRCPISAAALGEVERFLAAHPAAQCARILVIEQRALSNEVATLTAILHQSPQFLLLRHGQVCWHASHRAITAAAMSAAWAAAE